MVSYRFIDPSDVAQLYQSGQQVGKDFQIVDVRDDDYDGGHLPGAIRAPSELRTEQSVEDLVTKLAGVPKVIFHCTLSQVRGPKAASIYSNALSSRAPKPRQQADSPSTETSAKETAAEAARTFSTNPFTELVKRDGEQEVLVLRGGFGQWQALYKDDPKLVEGFDPKIWQY